MILIIDNYDSFTYNLYQQIAGSYHDVRVVRNDEMTVEDIAQLKPKGIIISPGPGRPEQAGICVELIRHMTIDAPILGVCLGHQAIVSAFGGEIINATEIMHGKEDYIFHHGHGLYQDMPSPFVAGRYHSLIANRSTLPKPLLIEAENSAGIVMGVRHVDRPIYGVQFHPESILTPTGDKLLRSFINLCLKQSSIFTSPLGEEINACRQHKRRAAGEG